MSCMVSLSFYCIIHQLRPISSHLDPSTSSQPLHCLSPQLWIASSLQKLYILPPALVSILCIDWHTCQFLLSLPISQIMHTHHHTVLWNTGLPRNHLDISNCALLMLMDKHRQPPFDNHQIRLLSAFLNLVSITAKNGIKLPNHYFDDKRIELCYLVNDIGVDIDSLLHFDRYVDRIVAKAYSHIVLLFRCFVSKNLHVFRQATICTSTH